MPQTLRLSPRSAPLALAWTRLRRIRPVAARARPRRGTRGRLAIIALLVIVLLPAAAKGQGEGGLGAPQAPPPVSRDPDAAAAPEQVQVQPVARDEEIQQRLTEILSATGWFEEPQVRVRDGVVFLRGRTESEEYKLWAGNLARNTQDVAAVVNKFEIKPPPPWDFQPAVDGLRDLGRSLVRAVPYLAFGFVVLLLAFAITRLTGFALRGPLRRRIASPLLRDLIARGVGVASFLIGLFIVFHVAGLTGIAFTVMGGTGLLGLVLGIAFRGITENFLASIFLSLQPPFRIGDFVEIGGVGGYVQRLTTRATVIMTLEGDHVQIPNGTVYSTEIRNYTSNPNRRFDFTVGIGYDDSIARAQQVALAVLAAHPVILDDPEPLVLVDSLGPATVNLRIYFWLKVVDHSWLKARSSVIRLTKQAFQRNGISMPDEARELIFPRGIPIFMHDRGAGSGPGQDPSDGMSQRQPPGEGEPAEPESTAISTSAEAGLRSESDQLKRQAERARTPDEGENLLPPNDRPGGDQRTAPHPR